jgi:hypothetical protein
LNVGALERALREIVRRHEALRTTFTAQQGRSMQVVHADGSVTLAMVLLGRQLRGHGRSPRVRCGWADHRTGPASFQDRRACAVQVLPASETTSFDQGRTA